MATREQNALKKKLDALTAEERANNFAIIQYINNLAATSNADISKWSLVDLFGAEEVKDGMLFTTNKKKINKVFFDTLANGYKKKETQEAIAETIAEEVREAPTNEEQEKKLQESLAKVEKIVEKSYKQIREKKLAQHNQNILHYQENIRSYTNEIERFIKALLKEKEVIRAFEDNPADKKTKDTKLRDELVSVLKEGIWTNPVYKDGMLFLNTTNDVLIKDMGTKEIVNMGKYGACLDFNNGMYITARPYENNFFLGKNNYYMYHPHINGPHNGGICWGNASHTAAEAMGSMDIQKALKILHALLSSYNDKGGYNPPSYFKNNGKQYPFKEIYKEFANKVAVHPDHEPNK